MKMKTSFSASEVAIIDHGLLAGLYCYSYQYLCWMYQVAPACFAVSSLHILDDIQNWKIPECNILKTGIAVDTCALVIYSQ